MNMTKKIVAIGGGEIGRTTDEGKVLPYELAGIDEEIVRLSGKERPRFLFLSHAQISYGAEKEKDYCERIERIYGGRLGCEFRWSKAADLTEDVQKAREDVKWADIIYEGGGDTVAMIRLWKQTGFDALLKEAWEAGKVMCGISAGGICWFDSGNTGVPEYKDREIDRIPGLGFIDAYFSPHCQLGWKRESEIRSLKHVGKVGLSVSNCSAVEIVGDEYRVICSAPADSAFRPYVLRTWWKNGVLFEEELDASDEFRPLERLLAQEGRS